MTSVLCLCGSPRRPSNSSLIAESFAEGAAAEGAAVTTVALGELAFNGCRNLFHCKTGGTACGQNDDLTPVLQQLADTDVLVLASPIYFTDVSSQMKQAIDRFFSFLRDDYVTNPEKSRLPPGKSLVMILTQGEAETHCTDVFDRYGRAFEFLGFKDRHLIRACRLRAADAVTHYPELLIEARKLAHHLVTARLGTLL